jgi:hypothetical protein
MAFSPAMNGAYFNGLDRPGGLDITLAKISGSPTTDYMLISLNVASSTSADINYGWNFPCILARNGQVTQWTRDHLVQVVHAGVTKGNCKRVWLVIGGATDNTGKTNAFTNMQTILNNGGKLKDDLLANFGAIVQAVQDAGVKYVGFDMDYEESGDLASAVTDVTVALFNQFGCMITFCPSFVSEQSNWITALQNVYSEIHAGSSNVQPVVGFNLQCYAGGGGNNPPDWATAVGKAPNTGVTDPDNFIWPIVSCDSCAPAVICSDNVAKQLQSWGSKGASLWCVMPSTLTEYSNAIAQGIA